MNVRSIAITVPLGAKPPTAAIAAIRTNLRSRDTSALRRSRSDLNVQYGFFLSRWFILASPCLSSVTEKFKLAFMPKC
jgi:hypothetical protein